MNLKTTKNDTRVRTIVSSNYLRVTLFPSIKEFIVNPDTIYGIIPETAVFQHAPWQISQS